MICEPTAHEGVTSVVVLWLLTTDYMLYFQAYQTIFPPRPLGRVSSVLGADVRGGPLRSGDRLSSEGVGNALRTFGQDA